MKRTFGFHHLAELGALQSGDGAKLTAAARIAADAGCTLFELACSPVNGMSANETADALQEGGINRAAYCRFFPGGENGEPPPFGDPTGEQKLVDVAVNTIDMDLTFIEQLRASGVHTCTMTGPTSFVLGQKSRLNPQESMNRMVKFLTRIERDLTSATVFMCVEYLRHGEDNDFIAGVDRQIELIDAVGSDYVEAHFDVYHSLQRDEDPAESIRKLEGRLGYLHCHGTDRVAPGSEHDKVDWKAVKAALDDVGYREPIVPEPFGQTIRDEVQVLGEGLPPAVPAAAYYATAHKTLTDVGIL